MSLQISLCLRSKIIVNQNELKFIQSGGEEFITLGDIPQVPVARKLKVTRKYLANCRIHPRMRKKIKNNFLFKVG